MTTDDDLEVRELIAGALHIPDAERAWFDRLLANIERDTRSREDGHALSEAELDGDIADRLCDLLLDGPVRVRVMGERSYWHPGQPPGSDIRGRCDYGREGWVRRRPYPTGRTGTWGVYVEDMTPGDDGNPTRYHQAHSLVILARPAAELCKHGEYCARNGCTGACTQGRRAHARYPSPFGSPRGDMDRAQAEQHRRHGPPHLQELP